MSTAPSPPPKQRIVAALLAFFLGTFGIHRFYLGHRFLGIGYVLFFWTGIPTFLGWIEGVWWLLMSDQRFAEKYG